MPIDFELGGLTRFGFVKGSDRSADDCKSLERREFTALCAPPDVDFVVHADNLGVLDVNETRDDDPEACRGRGRGWLVSALSRRRFASSSARKAVRTRVNSSFASERKSSSATNTSSSGNENLFFSASSASRFRFSTFLSALKCFRTREESVYGSEL